VVSMVYNLGSASHLYSHFIIDLTILSSFWERTRF